MGKEPDRESQSKAEYEAWVRVAAAGQMLAIDAGHRERSALLKWWGNERDHGRELGTTLGQLFARATYD